MADDRFQRLRVLFDAALETNQAPERFAARECGDDPVLAAELLRLLRHHHARPDDVDDPFELDRGVLHAAARQHGVVGERFGPFRIVEEIGHGGMGRVFRGVREDGAVRQDVAIKLLHAGQVQPALLRRFLTERRLLAELEHPGICRLIDAGAQADGSPFVIMELVRGQPLLDYCDARRLKLRQRLQLFRQVLAAVAHAHRHLVVHRDLKSSNILVDAEGQTKLLDFGIAKPLHDTRDGARTQTCERFFTPHSAAPEQVGGKPVGTGCDIYALGVLLYELLCGRPPFDFEGLSAGEIEQRIALHPPALLPTRASDEAARNRGLADARALRRALAGDLDAVAQHCLRKQPQERYRSVDELDRDIAGWLEQRPIAARRNERLYRAGKFVQRHGAASALGAALLLVAIGSAWAIGYQMLVIAEQRNLALLQRDRAQSVVDLLKQAFLAADPSRSAGGDVSAREVLAAARPALEDKRRRHPALYASLAATVAEVELALGLDTDAEALLRRALRTGRDAGIDADVRHTLLVLHARALTGGGELAAAQAQLDRARRLPQGETAQWRLAQARLLRHRDDAGAVAIARRVLAELAQRPPDDELATQARWELAASLRHNGQYRQALAVTEATLAWQAADPRQHPRKLLTRLRRVELLQRDGRTHDALEEARAIVLEIERRYGAGTPFAARARALLGTTLYHADAAGEAAAQYRRAVAVWRDTLGPTHPRTVRATYNLAYLLARQPQRTDEAETLFATAIAAGERRFGAQSNPVLFFRLGLAELLLARDRPGRALAVLLDPDAAAAAKATLEPENRADFIAALQRAMAAGGCDEKPRADCRTAARRLRELAHAPPGVAGVAGP